MKKFLAAFLCAAMALSLSACNENTETPNDDKDKSSVSDSKKDNDNSTDESKDNSSEGENNSEENSSTGGESSVESKPEESSSTTTESEPEDPEPVIEWIDAPEEDFDYRSYEDGVEITAYKGTGGAIRIPDTINGKKVFSIGEGAFKKANVTNVELPDGVTTIGEHAFDFCLDLMSITIPDGVTEIGYDAFYGCVLLKSITIPDSVTSISKYAFDYCRNIIITYKGTEYTYYETNDLYNAINGR